MSINTEELLTVCKDFIIKHEIHSADKIYQSDKIIEDATWFVEQICDVVGYVNLDGDEDTDLFAGQGGAA